MLLWQICFNVHCVGFGLLLIFQAFQEEHIRLLMTVIKYTEKKTLLYMLPISVPVYIPSQRKQSKKYTMLMLKEHYDHHNIKQTTAEHHWPPSQP